LFAVVIGPDELARGEVGLKWLRDPAAAAGSGRQESVAVDRLCERVVDAMIEDSDSPGND
jgi:hypothetical protein